MYKKDQELADLIAFQRKHAREEVFELLQMPGLYPFLSSLIGPDEIAFLEGQFKSPDPFRVDALKFQIEANGIDFSLAFQMRDDKNLDHFPNLAIHLEPAHPPLALLEEQWQKLSSLLKREQPLYEPCRFVLYHAAELFWNALKSYAQALFLEINEQIAINLSLRGYPIVGFDAHYLFFSRTGVEAIDLEDAPPPRRPKKIPVKTGADLGKGDEWMREICPKAYSRALPGGDDPKAAYCARQPKHAS